MAPNTGQASTRRQPLPPPPPPLPPPAADDDDDDSLDFSVFLDAPPAVPAAPAARPTPITTPAPAPFPPSFRSPFPPTPQQAPASLTRAPAAAAPAPAPQHPRAFVPAPLPTPPPQPQASLPSYHRLQRMRPARTPFAGLQSVFRVEAPASRNTPEISQQLQPPVSTHTELERGGGCKIRGPNQTGDEDDDDDNDNDNDNDGNSPVNNPDPLAQLSGSPYFPDPAAAAAAAALNHPGAAPGDPINPWIMLANAVFAEPSAGLESVRSAAAASGFGVVKSRSARRNQTVRQRAAGERGEVYRIDLECTSASPRDGKRTSTSTGTRTSRRRRGCRWTATLVQKVIRSDEIGGVDRKFWRFEQKPRAHVHNHPLAANAAEIPVNRRRHVELARDQIFALKGQPKATPQRIADYVNKHNPGFAITANDIKNLFYKETRIQRQQQQQQQREAEGSATAE
ncbi:hypothetical protein GGTG_00184 [Gaeumannomyces tritici R3-111a-1]|uniref:Uncharacterized protein n=1 Tax=Gaeumannomyces tritici (strain R3-111a-1) TaxID=644352 RepID=J3NFZ1_GAET3|nr:hypothetical protein GGTG_00184 [Gaeumannomyces tritici R3-111a-1]EJT80181.1 hypothetical protein GGTG_00184 [Gaeumannomyces tritici R3-111a-1]